MKRGSIPTFRYGETELAHLRRADPALGRAMDRIGRIERPVIPDLFAALVLAVICQQVSMPADIAIWTRLEDRLGKVTPERVCTLSLDELRQCGLSARKAEYVLGIGEAVLRGEQDLADLRELRDEAVIERLSKLRGVGRWTAEMLLIFSMERPDVASWGDFAIRGGMAVLYGLETLDRKQFELYRARYSLHGSVASLYLWAVWKEHGRIPPIRTTLLLPSPPGLERPGFAIGEADRAVRAGREAVAAAVAAAVVGEA